ncbi:MAG: hypothetical protein JWM40_1916 [Frankiales bacterium]|nr:hypothetical protein [Frankiales bacterium]
MNDDELRNRLARLDPQAAIPVDPFTSPRAQDLLERSMTTTELIHDDPSAPPPNRRWLAMAAAATVAVAGIVAAVVMTNGGSPAAPAKKTTLALHAPGGARPGPPGINSCIRFDVELLKAEPVAFAGTVTDVQPGTVTLDVTKWFKGGTADQVTVTTPDSSNVALEGVAFTKGEDVLVSAFDGTVVSCGFSGPDDPTLRTAYENAFGG